MVVVAVVLAAARAPAPKPSPNAVTEDLADRDRASLVGCWISPPRYGERETWTFRERGDHGLEVERDSNEVRRLLSPERAKHSSLMFDPSQDRFAFVTPGRIHGLMMLFALDRDHARIDASVFIKIDARPYSFTGNNLTLERCRT